MTLSRNAAIKLAILGKARIDNDWALFCIPMTHLPLADYTFYVYAYTSPTYRTSLLYNCDLHAIKLS